MSRKILLSFFVQLFIIKCLIAQPYTVSGKVYYSPDGMTQIGIENARVYSESPYIAEIFTDASGNYTFTNIPPRRGGFAIRPLQNNMRIYNP